MTAIAIDNKQMLFGTKKLTLWAQVPMNATRTINDG
jgi:hypothetical protein